jgi:beta-N-acetylhexosaminidase
MQGASGQGSMPERARAALQAGCDLVLVCNRLDAMDEVLDGLKWRAGPHHLERLGRLVPKGAAPGPAALRNSEVYQAALRDLDELAGV